MAPAEVMLMTQSADATSRREEEDRESLRHYVRQERERRIGMARGWGGSHTRCLLAKVKGMRLEVEPGLSTAPHTQQSHTATATDSKGAQIATIVRAQLMPIIFERPTVQTRGEVMSYVRGALRLRTRWTLQ